MNHCKIYFVTIPVALFLLMGCNETGSSDTGRMPSKKYHYVEGTIPEQEYEEMVYIPAYSDIYYRSGDRKVALTVTLSLRNTSLSESIYVKKVDYYDSSGSLVHAYLNRPIFLTALQSVEFIVENEESRGGAGANFIVDWTGPVGVKPVIQAVMIGTASNQGLSFVTDGVVIRSETKSGSPQEDQ